MRKNPLAVVFGLSALLHAYIASRLLPGLPIGIVGQSMIFVYLLLSTALTPAWLLTRTIQHRRLSDALAWISYLALGIFSSLFVLTVVRDIMLAACRILIALMPGMAPFAGLEKISALAVLALTVLVSLAGVFNARRLAKVVDVALPVTDLPEALSGFTIVQISDIHVGPTIKRGYLNAIVEAVNALKPDLVAVTGDLVDGSVSQLRSHVTPLSKLSARHGVYFVTGNHEYYSGAEAWIAELRRLGLIVLMNQNVVLEHDGAHLLVGGVTDFSAHQFHADHRSDPGKVLADTPQSVSVRILLAHQPRSAAAASAAGFDVQLSGHTHGGQFLPWTWFVRFQQPFTAGLNRVKNLWVYTSRGTGYWGPPIRFGAPSEITRLRLILQE